MTKTIQPQKVALVRRSYAEGATVRTIMSETRLAQSTVYRCLAGELDDGSGKPLHAIPLRRTDVPKTSRKALAARLWQAAGRQVQQIEDRLAQDGLKPRERDNTTRALAALVKTLRELSAFDQAQAAQKPRKGKKRKDTDDDPVPRDLDELRRELARRMDAFVDRRMAIRRGMGPGFPSGDQ